MVKLIIVCGWPVCGKSTLAKNISEKLGIHWVDIDSIRFLNFGRPNPNSNVSEKERERNNEEMLQSYSLLHATVDANLKMGRSLIITATFSRPEYYDGINEILKKYTNINLKILWCKPQNDSDEEIRTRLEQRIFGVNCWSAVNSLEHYKEVKNRYVAPTLPHIILDTSPPNTLEKATEMTLDYLKA